MSDVPIALFLSGGVDSAVIGALMRRWGRGSIDSLDIGFEEDSFDESESSRRTAELLGISHRIIRMPASQTAESLDHALWAMDQPTMDGLNAYWISRAAAEHGFQSRTFGSRWRRAVWRLCFHRLVQSLLRVAGWLKPLPQLPGRGLFDHRALPFRGVNCPIWWARMIRSSQLS